MHHDTYIVELNMHLHRPMNLYIKAHLHTLYHLHLHKYRIPNSILDICGNVPVTFDDSNTL